MNVDLERDLAAAGDLGSFVASLRQAPTCEVAPDFTARVMARVRAESVGARWKALLNPRAFIPLAACVAVCLALTSVLRTASPVYSTACLVACQRADGLFSESSAAPYLQAFAVTALAKDAKDHAAALGSAVGALVREQNAEGGWANAELSAQNVVALKVASQAGVAAAAPAYKRGLRYLRTHGIGELSAADFARAAKSALARVDAADRGLACSAALCATL